jgi:hypothetical protein
MRHLKPVVNILTVAGLLAATRPAVFAQCAMCKAAVGNSVESAGLASSMNLAVMVLLIPPVAMFCAFMVVLYRYRKAPDESAAYDGAEERRSMRAGLREEDKGARGPRKDDGEGPPAALARAT